MPACNTRVLFIFSILVACIIILNIKSELSHTIGFMDPLFKVNVFAKNNAGEILNKTSSDRGISDIRHGKEWKRNLTQNKFVIVLYRPYHGMLKDHLTNLNLSKCFHYQNCEAVYIRETTEKFIEADAVLIQGGHIPNEIPQHRDDDQMFVFVSIESPVYLNYTNVTSEIYLNYFNYTMTYRTDSDIQYLYGSVISNDTAEEKVFKDMESENNFKRQFSATVAKFEKNGYTGDINKNYSDIFREKTESLLWMVSHCQTQSKRESYIEELEKFTNVTNIGRCNANKSSSCPNKLNCEIELAKKFKFYLAFENSLCIDYITEKAFKWYSRDLIIVVRGARDYQKFLPKGTFIDAYDFTSPKSLARYLNKLGSDEQRYTDILKLKDHFKVIGEQEHAQIAYCNLCFKLNNLRQFRKSIKDVGAWWLENACVISNDTG